MLKFADKENLVQQKKADTTNTIENVKTDSISNTSLYDSLKDNINTVQKKPSTVESSNKKTFQAKTSDVMQMKSNDTGLPDNLKLGIENLSGYSMDDVKVHYNSPKPTQMKALAYTQGTDIHIAPGQEKHLGHEAWHVVQQKQGRVQPTTQMKGVNINDNSALEHEADIMGAKAIQLKAVNNNTATVQKKVDNNKPIQFYRIYYLENGDTQNNNDNGNSNGNSNSNGNKLHIKSDAEKASKKRLEKAINKENSYNDYKEYIGYIANIINELDKLANIFVDEACKANNFLLSNNFIPIRKRNTTETEEEYKKDLTSILKMCLQVILLDFKTEGTINDNKKIKEIKDIFNEVVEKNKSNEPVVSFFKEMLNYLTGEHLTNIRNSLNKSKVSELEKISQDQKLDTDESMIIVSHGARPYIGFMRCFADLSPEQLAWKISPIIPDGYNGEIYLDGCHTGEPTAIFFPKLNDGTSFAECFGKELVKLLKKSGRKANFTVKGNLGAAGTLDNGKESITLDDRSRDLVKQREILIEESKKTVANKGDKSMSEFREARNIFFNNKATSTDAHNKIYDDKTEELAGSATKMKYHFST